MAKIIDTERADARAHRRSLVACMAALVALCACGGGGDPAAAPADGVREQAKETTVLRVVTRDKFSYASHFEEAIDGCRTLYVEVFAVDSYIRNDGTPSEESLVRAQLVATDFCTGIENFLSGAAVPESLYFRDDLGRASVKATVVLEDGMGTMKTLDIDIAWDGGELTKTKYTVEFVGPTSRTVIKSASRIRYSKTLSGALVLDGVDLLAAGRLVRNNFTRQFVSSGKGSTIDITRTP